MKVFNSIQDFNSNSRTVVTLGTFDGVHIGHTKILERLVENAKKLDAESLVLTFFPHPRMVLQNDSDIKLLNTISEKTNLLEKSGLDNLIIHPFDAVFSNLSAEEFVKNILVDVFKIKKIIIGHDHRFGKNRVANINDLIAFGKIYDFEVEQISPQEVDEIAVSSTKIRNALHDGNVKLANNYLGINYSISGNVVKGRQLGRTIGFPTANIEVTETYKLIPKIGVYVVQSSWNNVIIYGIMNIGFNPTVAGEKQTIEVYFFNFNEEIYDQNLTVSFIDRLRNEQKFDSLEKLKEQLFKDQEAGYKIVENL